MPSEMAASKPRIKPSDGAESFETFLKLLKTKSAVSRPSRATAKKAVTVRARFPRGSAASSLPCKSALIPRALAFIQKTIKVTIKTAAIEVVPAKISSPRTDN